MDSHSDAAGKAYSLLNCHESRAIASIFLHQRGAEMAQPEILLSGFRQSGNQAPLIPLTIINYIDAVIRPNLLSHQLIILEKQEQNWRDLAGFLWSSPLWLNIPCFHSAYLTVICSLFWHHCEDFCDQAHTGSQPASNTAVHQKPHILDHNHQFICSTAAFQLSSQFSVVRLW